MIFGRLKKETSQEEPEGQISAKKAKKYSNSEPKEVERNYIEPKQNAMCDSALMHKRRLNF